MSATSDGYDTFFQLGVPQAKGGKMRLDGICRLYVEFLDEIRKPAMPDKQDPVASNWAIEVVILRRSEFPESEKSGYQDMLDDLERHSETLSAHGKLDRLNLSAYPIGSRTLTSVIRGLLGSGEVDLKRLGVNPVVSGTMDLAFIGSGMFGKLERLDLCKMYAPPHRSGADLANDLQLIGGTLRRLKHLTYPITWKSENEEEAAAWQSPFDDFGQRITFETLVLVFKEVPMGVINLTRFLGKVISSTGWAFCSWPPPSGGGDEEEEAVIGDYADEEEEDEEGDESFGTLWTPSMHAITR